MKPNRDWPCWRIMGCDNFHCPARKQPKRPCWEIVRKLNDYRQAFHVCDDCIVYLLKSGSSVLSKQEILTIMETKKECPLDI